jgi:hypothetical protein
MRRLDSCRVSRPAARSASFACLAWVTLSLITAVVGPFSTFDTMTIELRVLYWGGIIGSAVILSEIIRSFVARFDTLSPLHADLVVCADGAGVRYGHHGLQCSGDGITKWPFASRAWARTSSWCCWSASSSSVFRTYVRPSPVKRCAPEDKALRSKTLQEVPGFLRDIDPEIGRSVLWIEADDHYLRACALWQRAGVDAVSRCTWRNWRICRVCRCIGPIGSGSRP